METEMAMIRMTALVATSRADMGDWIRNHLVLAVVFVVGAAYEAVVYLIKAVA